MIGLICLSFQYSAPIERGPTQQILPASYFPITENNSVYSVVSYESE